jgi:hypothetical protein
VAEQEKVRPEEPDVESREPDDSDEQDVELHGGGTRHPTPLPPADA